MNDGTLLNSPEYSNVSALRDRPLTEAVSNSPEVLGLGWSLSDVATVVMVRARCEDAALHLRSSLGRPMST